MRSFNKHIILLLSLALFNANLITAQKFVNEGNKYFDRNMFEEAIPHYLKELEKGDSYRAKNEAREKLASCYRLTGRFLEANELYKTILERSYNFNKAENVLNYANSLKSSALYEEAAEQFRNYIELEPDDPMGKIYLKSCSMAQKWLDEPDEYYVMNLKSVNTVETDFAPVYFQDGIVITSSREGSKSKFINLTGLSEEINTDLYQIKLGIKQDEEPLVINMDMLNSFHHDGTATFSKDNKEVYFTRTVMGDKDKKSNVILNSLQILYSKIDREGNWSEPVSIMPFNSHEYSVGQPSLSADGKTIYFISDMPGGFGNTDIYYAVKGNDGVWSDPVNMGKEINTFGYELAPFILSNDTIFFSSDTHPGMGKLDIFYSVKKDGVWSEPKNLKPPINSIADDIGIVIDKNQNKGFFSSDRFNGNGKEDIYTLYNLNHPLEIKFKGNEIYLPDDELYNGLTYKIAKENNEAVPMNQEYGFFTYLLEPDSIYHISIRKNRFFYDMINVKISRNDHDSLFIAEIDSRNSNMTINGKHANPRINITKREIASTDKKKNSEPVIIYDTIINNIGIPEAALILQEKERSISKITTDSLGYFSFNDTLRGGIPYKLLALEEKLAAEEQPVEKITEEEEIKEDDHIQQIAEEVSENKETVQEVVEEIAEVKESPEIETVEEVVEETNSNTETTDEIITKNELLPEEIPEKENKSAPADSLNIAGKVTDNQNIGIPDVKIKVFSEETLEAESKSDTEGDYEVKVPSKENYAVNMNKEGFYKEQINLSGEELKQSGNKMDVTLPPIKKNTPLELKNIFFDLDKSSLRKGSIAELVHVTDFMKENIDVVIQLKAHTDTRGGYYYNIWLSQQRAAAVREYLINHGIENHRIISHGLGESFPVIRNAYTETQHEKNRRVEFSVYERGPEDKWYFPAEEPVNTSGFSILNDGIYSNNNPFTKNAPLPRGLFYRIKIASFSKNVDYDVFKGLFPIISQENSELGTVEYYAGLFTSFQQAQEALKVIKKNFFDAYILAYYDQKQISIQESIEFYAGQNKTIENSEHMKRVREFSASEEKPFFSIQIGAYRRTPNNTLINEYKIIADRYDLLEIQDGKNTVFAIGRFESYEDAYSVKQDIAKNNNVSEAFIIAILNEQKISINEARKILYNFN